MTDKDDYRIDGTIERVGFHTGTDPEAVQKIQERQRMYERIADRIRNRRNLSFGKVLRETAAKDTGASAETENPPAEE
ncbi:MAG: hypothetical protein JXQ27_18310 [Acidobacteria bacterium]|nr:hypothetical protein [Acidobacteriota bacterium]